ncbi:hypothetical protein LINPERHAP2_LOCUS44749 [Linum perenne]
MCFYLFYFILTCNKYCLQFFHDKDKSFRPNRISLLRVRSLRARPILLPILKIMMFSADRSRKKQQPRQSICLSISKLQFEGNLMEKRRAFDIVKDHLFPPPVKKLVSSTRKHERTMERNCMHHLEFVRICEEVYSKS